MIELAKETTSQLPATFESSYLLNLYQAVEREVTAEVPDITTKEGRARIKSLAAKVASSKTATDTPIRDYLREIKALPKILEANARDNVERYDSLKAQILAPLTEAAKPQAELIEWLGTVPAMCGQPAITANELASLVAEVDQRCEGVEIWPENAKKFTALLETARLCVVTAHDKKVEDEEREAELARLRAEALQREQEDRDRKIAEAAAAKAREEEAERARRDREAVERRAAEDKLRMEEQARRAAEAVRREQAAKDELAAAQARAEQQAKEAAEQAEKAAIERERQHQAQELAEQQRQAKARENDKANRVEKNREALVDFISAGIDEATAKTVITLIAKRQIRNISIAY